MVMRNRYQIERGCINTVGDLECLLEGNTRILLEGKYAVYF